jgi:hypothetical protein
LTPLLLLHNEQEAHVPFDPIKALHDWTGNPCVPWIVLGSEHRQEDQTCPEEYAARAAACFGRWLAGEGQRGQVVGG